MQFMLIELANHTRTGRHECVLIAGHVIRYTGLLERTANTYLDRMQAVGIQLCAWV